ncbi:hypothetical protein PIB30_056387 [Stylosanthes scabra]|uniref:pectinesterase n=1 Tax=Stylosanthes scabra TaxID=79078 RepID=A0ABU6UIV8_9FABA|nr:hypothetical protein [Stylosanthes scabra]
MNFISSLFLFITTISFWIYGAKGINNCGGNNIVNTIVVNQQGGNGVFTKVQDAIDSIQSNNDQWVKIYINPGIYTEKARLPKDKPCVILEGASIHNTVITYDDHLPANPSATFVFDASNVIVKDITFKNSYNVAKLPRKIKERKMQERQIVPAVAASVYGDNNTFYRCGFIGYQDTLFDASGRHYYKECYIEGEVDFIFGYARSYYEQCIMNAIGRDINLPGFVTAHGRGKPEGDPNGGFVFNRCAIIGTGNVNLGRAWGPFARVIFHGTYFGSLITPQGWDAWNGKGQEYKITFAEVNCKGPGRNTNDRVS